MSLLVLLMLLISACQPKVGLPNPASAYCEENDGTPEISQDEDSGQVGYCVFEDGSECEEWAFYLGECQPGDSLNPETGLFIPASVFCQENGGTLEIREDNGGGQVGYCVFDDGSECEEWAFYREECQPSEDD
jgi:putative hemolysin